MTAPPAEPVVTPAERIQRDQAMGADLARQFESQLSFTHDKEVLIYLRELASRITQNNPELKASAVGVLVVADRGARWKDYGLPGNRIYLSSGLLRRVEYENELAAAIALELSQLLKRHVPRRLQEGRVSRDSVSAPTDYPSLKGLVPEQAGAIDFFSPTGVFAYPDEYYLEATDGAIALLYQAGFDPRGLVSLWTLYQAQPAHSPLEPDLLRKLVEKTRYAIAQYSPLRNPIVRSPAFLAIRKRMQRL